MKQYKYLLFDNDDTLMDFKKAEEKAFEECYNSFDFPTAYSKDILKVYSDVNLSWWKKLELGQCTRDELKIGRFSEFLEKMELEGDAKAMMISYPICLGKQNYLLPNALELIEKLSEDYKIIIITNGIETVQNSRIGNSPIFKYIHKVFISDEVGFSKPSKEFFQYVLKNTGITQKEQCLIIGDSLSSDIKGANNIGIDCVWFNPNNEQNPGLNITYEVSGFKELENILL